MRPIALRECTRTRGTSSRISFRERFVSGAYLARLAAKFSISSYRVCYSRIITPNTMLRRLTKQLAVPRSVPRHRAKVFPLFIIAAVAADSLLMIIY
jgi:hypothetical protein